MWVWVQRTSDELSPLGAIALSARVSWIAQSMQRADSHSGLSSGHFVGLWLAAEIQKGLAVVVVRVRRSRLPISKWELVVGSLVRSQEAHRRF